MYTHRHTYVYKQAHICTHHRHTQAHTCTHTGTHVHTQVHICTHTGTHVCTHTRINKYNASFPHAGQPQYQTPYTTQDCITTCDDVRAVEGHLPNWNNCCMLKPCKGSWGHCQAVWSHTGGHGDIVKLCEATQGAWGHCWHFPFIRTFNVF